ncbi:MAG: hypothetical protein JWQ20_2876 [Conexibacter sp.]|nr:hypothetical protein [Conexibacter sp.]
MVQDPDSTPAEAIGELTDELLRIGASLSQVVAHMSRSAAAAPPDAEPLGEVLRRLLCEVLEPELDAHVVSELLDAAAIVGLATDAINRDLFLVDVRPPSRPAGAPRGNRRPPVHTRRPR